MGNLLQLQKLGTRHQLGTSPLGCTCADTLSAVLLLGGPPNLKISNFSLKIYTKNEFTLKCEFTLKIDIFCFDKYWWCFPINIVNNNNKKCLLLTSIRNTGKALRNFKVYFQGRLVGMAGGPAGHSHSGTQTLSITWLLHSRGLRVLQILWIQNQTREDGQWRIMRGESENYRKIWKKRNLAVCSGEKWKDFVIQTANFITTLCLGLVNCKDSSWLII